MLATIRNLLIWISINVLYVLSLIYYGPNKPAYLDKTMYLLQGVNFTLWLLVALGEGSSLENTDIELGYNCRVIDWMLMSGILLVVNLIIVLLGTFILDKLTFELAQIDLSDSRRIKSTSQEKQNLIYIIGSGMLGSLMMFLWDFIAFNWSQDKSECQAYFSGDNFARSVLCFICKLITMQLNPLVIYYIMYHSRRDDFSKEE